jgi:transposase InsO family protein
MASGWAVCWAVAAVGTVAIDLLRLRAMAFRRRVELAAEVLVLRKQLAMLQERAGRRRVRVGFLRRASLALLSRLCGLRPAIVVVQPATVLRWHRAGFRLLWRWRCRRGGRPAVPADLRRLIREMAHDNPSWGEERIASELSLKLGLRVSSRTVRRYLPPGRRGRGGRGDQRWATFVRNHARTIVACDFGTVVTATFRVLYVFVVLELGSRRIVHWGVTDHPTAEWTQQRLREAIPVDHAYRFLIHDRDAIFSRDLDRVVRGLGLRVLRSPVQAPKANAFCERLIGTMRRECLDWLIPFGARHLRALLRDWVRHYNEARPHTSLGPGIPDPPPGLPVERQAHRHRLAAGSRVVRRPVLGGLHHEYRLDRAA